jgi:hypothetical protein
LPGTAGIRGTCASPGGCSGIDPRCRPTLAPITFDGSTGQHVREEFGRVGCRRLRSCHNLSTNQHAPHCRGRHSRTCDSFKRPVKAPRSNPRGNSNSVCGSAAPSSKTSIDLRQAYSCVSLIYRFLHRSERGARGRPCRDDRTKRSRSTFSACSARSNHCFCSCSKLALVTGSVAAAAAISHLRASQRRFSDRALMQIRDS